MSNNYLSIDIGGTNVKFALLNHSGEIVSKEKIPTSSNKENFLKNLDGIVTHFNNIKGLAICAPGKIVNNVIYFGGALPFLNGVDFGKRYRKLGFPINVINDGKASVLAENWLGSLKNLRNCASITLGTGIGGGIIANGRLLLGMHGQAGEVSFMKLTDQMNSKNIAGFKYSAVKMISEINKIDHNSDLKNGISAFKLINQQNISALKIFQNFCFGIASVILNIQTVVDLQRYAISGGISAQPVVISGINQAYEKLLDHNLIIKKMLTRPEIVAAKFKNNANLFGALYALLLTENDESL